MICGSQTGRVKKIIITEFTLNNLTKIKLLSAPEGEVWLRSTLFPFRHYTDFWGIEYDVISTREYQYWPRR